jgi:hypothetical protein
MRNAEVGTRNSRVRSCAAKLGLLVRVPRSAFRVCLCFAACTPVTTRPAFQPDPRALVVLLDARPARVTTELTSVIAADSLEVARFNVRDGYVETAWYDAAAHRTLRHERDITDLAATVKIRFWADPYVPGQARLTIEPVYRPRYDPSRTERDREAILPREHPGYKLAERIVDQLKQRLGVPKAAQ